MQQRSVFFSMFFSVLLLSFLISACTREGYDALYAVGDTFNRNVQKPLAERGDAEAQYAVGKSYCCGPRPKYDTVKALHWFCRAARQDQRDAQMEVGRIYDFANDYEGSIVPRNLPLAFVYYRLSEKGGSEKAKLYRQDLESRLTPEEKEKSNHLLALWPDITCEISR